MKKSLAILLSFALLLSSLCLAVIPAFAAPEAAGAPISGIGSFFSPGELAAVTNDSGYAVGDAEGTFTVFTEGEKTYVWSAVAISDAAQAAITAGHSLTTPAFISGDITLSAEPEKKVSYADGKLSLPATATNVSTGTFRYVFVGAAEAAVPAEGIYSFPAAAGSLTVIAVGKLGYVWTKDIPSSSDIANITEILNQNTALQNTTLFGLSFDAARFVSGNTFTVATDAPTAITLDADYKTTAALPENTSVYTLSLHHHFGNYAITPATCTENGLKTLTCTDAECTALLLSDVLTALGHDILSDTAHVEGSSPSAHHGVCARCNVFVTVPCAFGEAVVTASTCIEQGESKKTCTVCGYEEITKLELAPHTIDKWGTDTDKNHAGICSVCKAKVSEAHTFEYTPNAESYETEFKLHDGVCKACGEKTTAGCTMNLVAEESVAASCTIEGKSVYRCPDCNGSYTKTLDMLGHSFTKYATKDDGTIAEVCERCGIEQAHTHAFGEWKTVKEATCTEKGSQERTCACGTKETEELPALTHDYKMIDLGDGNHASVCSRCQTVDAATKAPHTITYTDTKDGNHTKSCSACTLKVTEAHTYTYTTTEATCTKAGIKTGSCVCGNTVTESVGKALGHKYKYVSTVNNQDTFRCERCGETYTQSSSGNKIDPDKDINKRPGKKDETTERRNDCGKHQPTGDSALLASAAGVVLLSGAAFLFTRKKKY